MEEYPRKNNTNYIMALFFVAIGCVDESGVFHEIGDEWMLSTDSCQSCSCASEYNIMCKAKECSNAKQVCTDGKEPTAVFDVNGCCPTYVCDCE